MLYFLLLLLAAHALKLDRPTNTAAATVTRPPACPALACATPNCPASQQTTPTIRGCPSCPKCSSVTVGMGLAVNANVAATASAALLPKKCICGSSCTLTGGASGYCQSSGVCSSTRPLCRPLDPHVLTNPQPTVIPDPAPDLAAGAALSVSGGGSHTSCPLPPCAYPTCPKSQQTIPKGPNGCPLCPICNSGSGDPGCTTDNDCPAGQNCVSKQCQAISAQRCSSSAAATNPSPPEVVAINVNWGSNPCPAGFRCVNGYCRSCPMVDCKPISCPGGHVERSTNANGCPACPHCVTGYEAP